MANVSLIFFTFLFSYSLLSSFMLLCCQHHCAHTKGQLIVTLLFPVTVICCSTCTMIKQLHCNGQLIVVFLFLKLPLLRLLLWFLGYFWCLNCHLFLYHWPCLIVIAIVVTFTSISLLLLQSFLVSTVLVIIAIFIITVFTTVGCCSLYHCSCCPCCHCCSSSWCLVIVLLDVWLLFLSLLFLSLLILFWFVLVVVIFLAVFISQLIVIFEERLWLLAATQPLWFCWWWSPLPLLSTPLTMLMLMLMLIPLRHSRNWLLFVFFYCFFPSCVVYSFERLV